jgi:hypothetical protein
MPFKIILPASIIISILVGGFIKYYTDRKDNNHIIPEHRDKKGEEEGGKEAFPDHQHSNYSTQNSQQKYYFGTEYLVLVNPKNCRSVTPTVIRDYHIIGIR